jgi:eIF-2B alpha/beta/delta-like uncharacterized protein
MEGGLLDRSVNHGATESALQLLERIEEELLKTPNWKEFSTMFSIFAMESIERRPTSALLTNTMRSLLKFAVDKYAEGQDIETFKKGFYEKIEEVKVATVRSVEKLSDIGARWLPDGSRILTHSYSTSVLKIIEKGNRLGKIKEVFVTESRPGGEGVYTAELLSSLGIKTNLIVDSAVNYFMGEIDFVLVGAEAITAHGALVNKVGTSQIALSAYKRRTRLIVASGTYKFSFESMLGDRIKVPFLDASSLEIPRDLLKLDNFAVSVPLMDVTPPEFIDAIITEIGITSPEGVPILLWEVYGGWIGSQPDIKDLINKLRNIS